MSEYVSESMNTKITDKCDVLVAGGGVEAEKAAHRAMTADFGNTDIPVLKARLIKDGMII